MGEAQARRWSLSPQAQAVLTALIYMVAVLGFVGGAGLWLPFVMGKHASVDALTTLVMGILAPIFVDLLLDFEVYGLRLSKLWRMALMGVSIVAGAFALTGLLRETATHGWTASIVALLLSLAVWLALVLKCDRFLPNRPLDGSLGGPPSAANLGGRGLS